MDLQTVAVKDTYNNLELQVIISVVHSQDAQVWKKTLDISLFMNSFSPRQKQTSCKKNKPRMSDTITSRVLKCFHQHFDIFEWPSKHK